MDRYSGPASKTESAWSDFDFIVEVPQDYSHWNKIYRQMFRARLVAFDRDLRRTVTTKSSSNIEEDNDTVKWTDKKWTIDVSLRVATKGSSVQQLQTTKCLLQLYENLYWLLRVKSDLHWLGPWISPWRAGCGAS